MTTSLAAGLALVLGGRKIGSTWIARCPAHEDREPSLAISDAKDGKILVHCHAGCDQRDVIAALRALGAWESTGQCVGRFARSAGRCPPAEPDLCDVKRIEGALAVWRTSQSAEGTPAATYLRSRGLGVSLPSSIRFHAGLRHPSGGIWPAMVALVTQGVDGMPTAIHRTFLARDGSGKAPIEPAKMMLGPCRGGAVRFGVTGDMLMVGEGIETCLAAMQATGHPAWAALSTSGLRNLDLPSSVREVIVLADGDDPGESAAQACAQRWKSGGRHVRIARPPRGMDFNDLLLGRTLRELEEPA